MGIAIPNFFRISYNQRNVVREIILICIGIPKPRLRLNRLAAGASPFEKPHAFYQTCPFLLEACVLSIWYVFMYFRKSNRRGRQRHSKWQLNFGRSSRIDPIGDQNDVPELEYLSIFCVYVVYLECI